MNRSRFSDDTVRNPCAKWAAFSRAVSAWPSVSTARTVALSARRRAKVPTPEKRSSTLRLLPTPSDTRRARVSSPRSVACRKAPGAGATFARPIWMRGGRRSIRMSPWLEMRARSSFPARPIRAWAISKESLPVPRTSTSSPSRLAVMRMSRGLPSWFSICATARAAGRARARPGARMGQSSSATMSWLRARMKPTTVCTRPSASRSKRAWKVARRRPSPWASIMGSTSTRRPAWSSAEVSKPRFQSA